MADIDSIVRNHPNCFTKPADINKKLACYSLREWDNTEIVTVPRKTLPFEYGGRGGLQLFFNSEEKKVYMDHTDKHTAVIGSTASKKVV